MKHLFLGVSLATTYIFMLSGLWVLAAIGVFIALALVYLPALGASSDCSPFEEQDGCDGDGGSD